MYRVTVKYKNHNKKKNIRKYKVLKYILFFFLILAIKGIQLKCQKRLPSLCIQRPPI